jgi:CheY-like chemotaxis protein
MTRTLLVIDDNKSVRESLRFLFVFRGYSVLVAESGPEGIALAAQQSIDGAIVDVNMPGMNGVAVCRALHAQAAELQRPIAVWMMTGARTPELMKSAQEAGAITLFAKPFDFSELFRQFDEKFGGPPQAPKPTPDVLDEL